MDVVLLPRANRCLTCIYHMMIIKSNRDGNEFAWIQFKRLIFSYLKRTFFGVYLNFIERLRLAVYLPIESDKMKRRDEQVLHRMFCWRSKRSRNIMKITFPLEFLQIEFDDANLEIPWKFCLSLYLISFHFIFFLSFLFSSIHSFLCLYVIFQKTLFEIFYPVYFVLSKRHPLRQR